MILTVNLYVPAASPVSVQVVTFFFVFVFVLQPLLRFPQVLHVPLVNEATVTKNPTGGFVDHVRTISPTFAPATAQTLCAVVVHAVSTTALPLMTGALLTVSLLSLALLSGALLPEAPPPHAARTVTVDARSAAAAVHLPAVVRLALPDRAFSMCSFPSQMRVLFASARSTVFKVLPGAKRALPCKHGVLESL
jgi:hypothetical protein